MKNVLFIITLSLLFVAGCVTAGKNFDSHVIKKIKNNVTMKSEIQQWLGYPYMTGVDNGSESWNYHFTKAGAGDTLSKDLYIVFTDEGVVKSHTFSTSFPDEMSLPK
ncbi:hypothetical protein MNBD_NITROSPINAE02-1863 [hydrothermal vent metagenome]|uniref:Outer membrane protein assembly factor BamE domain-containing protein n=1 Tax=hydrothermal vent metagenome TaxID=652676 RepID=A0A3B1BET0_9ZZZZ